MSTRSYSPVRSAIILAISFLLPLLLSFYSDRLLNIYASLWSPSANSAAANSYNNATIQADSILAQQETEYSSRLLQDIRRDVGKWNSNHPRWRLMNSMKAYLRYGEERTGELDVWRKRYKKLPRSQRSILERTTNYTNKLNSVEDLMLKNANLAEDILAHNLQYYGVSRSELEAFVQDTTSNGTSYQKGTTLYAMKHFTRDWSTEGSHERDATYPCVLQALRSAFPREGQTAQEPTKVLVPGSGLGRLGHEIAALGGFAVTLNEMSPSMNMAYHYLSTLSAANAATIHPYVDWWSHRATTAHLKRAVTFPDDIDTLSLSPFSSPSISLIEGDFTTALTSHSAAYDAIATHFFLDTAPNILTYLETLHSLLKPGGVWINFGPLLYGTAPAVQLSMDEVIAVAEDLGFMIEEVPAADQEGNGDGGEGICGRAMEFDARVRGKEVPYASDVESLSRNAYLAQFWVARKKG